MLLHYCSFRLSVVQAWELSAKMQICVAVKLTFCRERKLQGKEIGSTNKKKKGSTGFSSALNNHKTYRARSRAAIACLRCVILNTVTCCYSRGLATGVNTVILTRFCSMFQLRRSKCYESFESERCTVSVASVNRGKMFDGCSCANSWSET